jgi:hypothetical protein
MAEKILHFSDLQRLREASVAAHRLAQQYSQRRCYQELLQVLQDLRR